MCDIFWKGSFQHEKWPWDYDKWGVLTCTFPSYNRLCSSWDSRLSASCDGAPCKTHLFPNWPSEGMINCLEVASCQLACDLCSLCSNHLLGRYEAASPFLSPFRTYYRWERTGPGLRGSPAKIGTLAPSALTAKEIYRLILSSLLQFSRIVPAMSRAPGIKQNRECSPVPWDSNCWAITCQTWDGFENPGN